MTSPGMNPCLKFLRDLLILAVILVVADRVSGTLLRKFYFTQVAGDAARTTFSIDSVQADLLILGSSRSTHHYVPAIFKDSLGLTAYNTGRDGNYLFFNYALLRSIFQRYKPEVVILDISLGDLYYNTDSYDRLSSLLPYYQGHPEIREIVNLKSPYERIKLLSKIYPFNSLLLNIITGNLDIHNTRAWSRSGYLPLTREMKDTRRKFTSFTGLEIDKKKLEVLSSFIALCRSNGVRVILVESPVFAMIYDPFTPIYLKKLAKEENIRFYDFTHDLLFLQNPSWFQDNEHLNEKGALEFSRILSGMIRNEWKDEGMPSPGKTTYHGKENLFCNK
jgi:hypothetical protein